MPQWHSFRCTFNERPQNLCFFGRCTRYFVRRLNGSSSHTQKASSTFSNLSRPRPPPTPHVTASSSTDRIATPPATQYVLKDTFDQIVEKGAKSKTKSFLSTTQRFDRGVFDIKGVGDKPGPGAYNVNMVKVAAPPPRSRAQSRSTLPQCARFSAPIEPQNSVGPGSHDIAGSLIKKTFNITFGGASVLAGAGRVAHRVYQARTQGDVSQVVAGSPATQGSWEPAVVSNSLDV